MKNRITDRIEELAGELGFADVGIARAEHMDEEAARLREWLDRGYHGSMTYMERHFEKRVDPTIMVPGARSVVCLSYNYATEHRQRDPQAPKLSKYAFGRDYHKVVKKKLKTMLTALKNEFDHLEGRVFVDSAPVLERDWARRSGLGWVGKNTLLIHPKKGSYFFLAEMILNVELNYGIPMRDYCGTCTRCIDACPTDAIDEEGYLVDGSRCISYLTIEHKGEIPGEFVGKMENWVFGCDICQEVCPWNRFSQSHDEPDFEPKQSLLEMTAGDWHELDEDRFDRLFAGSAVKRTKYRGLRRNLDFLSQDPS